MDRRCLRRCLVAAIMLAMALVGVPAALGGATTATSLQVTYSTSDFTLHYTLDCGPASGTLVRAAAACTAIARNPIMVHGEPPEPLGTAVRSCPKPRETIRVSGTYEGAPAAADGDDTCGGGNVLRDWQPFVPTVEYLDRIRVNRGAGPLRLGEARATVRALLGKPTATILGADVYVSEMTAIGAVTRSGEVAGSIREMFAVGYSRHGRVTTIISNWLAERALRGSSSSPLTHPRSVICAGRRSLASRPFHLHVPSTILWPSAGNSTVIVTSAPTAGCRLARASEQPVLQTI